MGSFYHPTARFPAELVAFRIGFLLALLECMSLLQKSEHSVIYEAGMADFRIGLSLPIPK